MRQRGSDGQEIDEDLPLRRRGLPSAGARPQPGPGGRRAVGAAAAVALVVGAIGGYLVGHGSASSTGVPVIDPPEIGVALPAAKAPVPEGSGALGAQITQEALRITATGPTDVKASTDGTGLLVTFQISMTNIGAGADIAGPETFGIRCDANRTGDRGGFWSTSTASGGKRIASGQTVTGTAVVSWLEWDSSVRCTGPTNLEAVWPDPRRFVSWTLPASVVAQVNAAVH